MSSKRSQIAAAMLEAWNVDGAPVELVREPFRQQVVNDTTPVRCGLYLLTDDPTQAETERDRDETVPARIHEAVWIVETRACGTDGDVPEDVVDAVECWAVKVWNDNRLDGLVQFMRTAGSELHREIADRPLIRLITGVRVKYVSDAHDFEAQ